MYREMNNNGNNVWPNEWKKWFSLFYLYRRQLMLAYALKT